MGYESNATLETVANLGVTLLLFSIGLKLDIKTLLKKEVWGAASGHIILSTFFFTLVLLAVKTLGFRLAMELEWRQAMLLGFALSFSSTVFGRQSLRRAQRHEHAVWPNCHWGVGDARLIRRGIFKYLYRQSAPL